eukprot:jgi/Phyca11/14263/fgenesh1_pg.PHYCAscaffold_7_\
MRLMAAGVERVTYIDYAMKGKLKNCVWIDDLFRDIPEATVVVDVAAMTKPSTAGRVQLVRWRRSRPEGCKGATHELYGAMQAPPFYGSVSAKCVRDRNVVDATMKKCLVYSRAAHVFKSTLKPGRLDQPRRMKFRRLSNEYFEKLLTAFTEQQADMCDMPLLDTLRANLTLTNVQDANVFVIDEDDVEMDGVGAADGSETESEDGQEAVIDVDEDETDSENDLDFPVADVPENDVDRNQLYNIVVTQSGQFVPCGRIRFKIHFSDPPSQSLLGHIPRGDIKALHSSRMKPGQGGTQQDQEPERVEDDDDKDARNEAALAEVLGQFDEEDREISSDGSSDPDYEDELASTGDDDTTEIEDEDDPESKRAGDDDATADEDDGRPVLG